MKESTQTGAQHSAESATARELRDRGQDPLRRSRRFGGWMAAIVVLLVLIVFATAVSANAASVSPPVSAFRQARHSSRVIEIKFADGAEVSLDRGHFGSETSVDIGKVRRVVGATADSIVPLLDQPSSDARARRKAMESQSGAPVPDMASYFRITVRTGEDVDAVSAQLASLPGVELAYPAPEPIAPPTTASFVGEQAYLGNAPVGLGATKSKVLNGGTGASVTIADIEYSWNANHEDLAKARLSGSSIAVGTPSDPFSDTNHGTAVLGILIGSKNSFGVNGIAYGSGVRMINAYSLEYSWSPAMAIDAAIRTLTPGDVVLLEQQTYGPSGELLPIEWIPSVYDSIRAATAAGLVVIEAAGNGYTNLDDPIYGSRFPLGKPNSGAIMVGAGQNCFAGYERNRTSFTDYGTRVDVQGAGECVVTTGYGSRSSATPDSLYMSGFSGTSSASATVAGAAAVVSSTYRAATGARATPTIVRNALIKTGTPQRTGVPGHIGPLPDAFAAALSFDAIPPSAPTSVVGSLDANSRPLVKWTAGKDNLGVKGYNVYRNGTPIATTGKVLSYVDRTALSGSSTYEVRAVDYVGHLSAYSSAVVVAAPLR